MTDTDTTYTLDHLEALPELEPDAITYMQPLPGDEVTAVLYELGELVGL